MHVRIASIQDDEVVFVVELQPAGIFEVAGTAPEELPILLKIRYPEILTYFRARGCLRPGGKGWVPPAAYRPGEFSRALYPKALPQ